MENKSIDFNIVIDPSRVEKEYLKDLFRYRELFYFFCWRDILVRYKQAFFGVSWAVIRPLVNMVLFTFIFQKIAKLPSSNVNYGLFVLAGMLPWQLCSNAIVDTSSSIVNNSNLISKTYFPRMIIPAAQIVVHLTDFMVGIVMLLIAGFWIGACDYWSFFLFPLFVLVALVLCVGTGLWLSAITVQYRDFRFIVPFVLQFGMFISPVGYGTFTIPEKIRWFYFLNPMVGIIDGFRWAFFGISYPEFPYAVMISVIFSLLILITGYRYFRKMESSFADRI